MRWPIRARKRPRAWPACAGLALALTGCAGTSELEACVQHSVDEGLTRAVAEQACRDAGRDG